MGSIERRSSSILDDPGPPVPVNSTFVWNPGDGAWISFLLSGILDHDVKATMQSSGSGEPVPANVPWSYNAAR